ncbi:hypothetical protein PRZ48_009667 [Zasmidium cellare]|uniref:Major facilitator superfamily (MFS) profile domain-containing protein n=1 Tax=Zasmidium cellare TaxID=395010 RepID=A0ABR0EDD3_ZASCE|nr:hypothetical protein PRZ48_009667 [Zasmidium cellare]
MPASQLKRLKASLRDQGVTGPQKSKKQKKQQSAGKTASDRVQRNAALQQIRDSFNPFELRATNARPEKFKSASAKDAAVNGKGRYKEVLHRPGVSKSAGEEMRRATLLPEMHRRNKVGGLLDRRIGEGDVDITPEEKAVQRFAKEKERKAKGRSLFDLEGSDDEAGGFGAALTHGGRRIDDLAADDFGDEVSGGSDEEEDDGELLRKKRRRSDEEEEDENEGPADTEEQQPERKKTKKEVMEEVIAKSKMHKYERQKAKEDDDDLRMELDQGIGELMGLLQGVKKPAQKEAEEMPANNSTGPVVNPDRQRLLDGLDRDKADKEYDVRLKELARDTRAKPSERSKTAEEKAAEEAERLRVLEEKRLKRMRGEDVEDDAPQEDAADGHDLEGDEDIPDEAAEFGFTSSVPQAKEQGQQDVQPDEDEFDLDGDLVASDEDVDLSEDESDASSDGETELNAPEDEEDEFVKDILGPETASGANDLKVGERGTASAGSGLAFTYNCPRSHTELLELVQDLPPEQLVTVVQRIRALYHPSLSASNKESMADFSCALVDHLAYMGKNKQPMTVVEQIIRHLHSLSRTYPTQIAEQFRRNLAGFQERGQPDAGDLVILTAIGSIYPTSDHWHQVVTPAVTLMARWLGLNAPSHTKHLSASDLMTGAFLVALCLKYQGLSKRYIPEALRFTLQVLKTSIIDNSKLLPYVANLLAMADLWKDRSAFIEIFTPALAILKKRQLKQQHQTLTIMLQQSRLRRRPLELHHHRKLPIRTSVPKFEENFNPDKHYDPDKERSDAKKLEKEYKRERKGALRELRKDANFIAREQLKEKRARDEEYEKKYRRLVASVQAEEGAESNAYAREKAKRTGKRYPCMPSKPIAHQGTPAKSDNLFQPTAFRFYFKNPSGVATTKIIMESEKQPAVSEKQASAVVQSSQDATTDDAVISPDNADSERNASISRLPAWRRFLGVFWDTFSCSPQERKHLLKLDSYMLSYMCLAYFIKQIDQTNISNAFVSGMQEDLALYGNERNWLNTYFNVGILIGTIPAQLIQAQYIRPSVFIPACEIFWSILVIGMAFAKNVETLYALRFLIGFAEACVFPGFAALLGGWYGPMQLAKRAAIFEQSSAVGNMFSGYLQAALYEGMDGVHGLRGWRWMFVFDGIMGIPVAAWGLFAVPDLPHTTRAFYWSDEEKQYGIERVESFGRSAPEKLTLSVIGRVFTNWRLWLFVLPYLMVGQAAAGTKYFNLYLKDAGYSVVQTNVLPTAGDALSIVAALAFGIAADQTGWNATLVVIVELLVILSNVLLAVWELPKGALLFAYYLSYAGMAAQPIVIAWGSHLAAADPTLRQMLVATGNVISYTFNAWLPLGIFPTYDAPKYDYGYQILILFGGLAIIGTIGMHVFRAPFAEKRRRSN